MQQTLLHTAPCEQLTPGRVSTYAPLTRKIRSAHGPHAARSSASSYAADRAKPRLDAVTALRAGSARCCFAWLGTACISAGQSRVPGEWQRLASRAMANRFTSERRLCPLSRRWHAGLSDRVQSESVHRLVPRPDSPGRAGMITTAWTPVRARRRA